MTLVRRYGDLAVGVVAAVAGIVVAAASDATEGPMWANVAGMVALGALLALRGHHPVPTAYAFLALMVVSSLWLLPPPRSGVVWFGLLLFSYSAGTWRRPLLAYSFMALLLATIVIADRSIDAEASDYLFPAVISLAAYGAGRNAIFRAALATELHEAALQAEDARAAAERRAAAAERRRIAREMHDVVAHSISVMVVQAGGARRILQRDRARAAAAGASIERTGRETLLEMRRLLGVMHGDGVPAELGPSPTLADLDDLCARHNAVLAVEGHARAVPTGLETSAFRVVQAALEDAERVVPGCAAEVTVTWTPAALSLCVADDRPYAGGELVGVRERVALYDGELSTGTRPQGDGYQLDVRFPLHHPAAIT
jgi:signal transduction histidine kinase